MKRYIVTGASSGLGAEIFYQIIYSRLLSKPFKVYNWSKETGVDITNPDSIFEAWSKLEGQKIDGLINCAGTIFLDWIPNIKIEDWDRVMNTNARGIFLVTQRLLENLRGGIVCNIISNAAKRPMTNSLVYNASKAAAQMMTLQMARELKKTHNITVFGISPNKLKGTAMSNYVDNVVPGLRGWTEEFAKKYQVDSMPAGEETDVKACAEFISWIVCNKNINKFMNGTILPFGG